MSGHLPVVSGKELIKWMVSMGYRVVRQKGSHLRLERSSPLGTHAITVPFHKEIARGTLNNIIDSIARATNRNKLELMGDLARF